MTRAFEDALAGRLTAAHLSRELRKHAPQGVTQGSLMAAPDYLTLPVLQ